MLPIGKMSVIIGGQAGSESKGKLSAWLCDKERPDLLVMTASPNAGHTAVTPEGEKKVSYHLPIGSIFCDCPIVLGPASLINPSILAKEVQALEIDPRRIYVDPRASIITADHIRAETQGGLSNLGSTLQGVGACRSSKMNRLTDHIFVGDGQSLRDTDYPILLSIHVAGATQVIHTFLNKGGKVLCESTQGFDLDLEHGIDHHYCTSKMVNTSMILAEAGVPPQLVGNVFGVVRPYPIRVNNRTGSSGPYAGSAELSWADVANRCHFPGSPDEFGEITTTTKLPRRVFDFSWSRFSKFVEVCRPTHLCLQFANYLDWSVFGATKLENSVVDSFVAKLEAVGRVPVSFIGTGPGHHQMIERFDSNWSSRP